MNVSPLALVIYLSHRHQLAIDASVDRRAEQLFGAEASKRILKVLHFFSLANNIERYGGNNELIFDLEHAVNDSSAIHAMRCW